MTVATLYQCLLVRGCSSIKDFFVCRYSAQPSVYTKRDVLQNQGRMVASVVYIDRGIIALPIWLVCTGSEVQCDIQEINYSGVCFCCDLKAIFVIFVTDFLLQNFDSSGDLGTNCEAVVPVEANAGERDDIC